jgi:hypothetical protein
MQLAIFGIDEGGLGLAVNLLVLFLIVVYLALIYWTYLDAKRRIQDPVLIACATAASVFPFIGTVVYTILRPPEFLEDREERELELRAAELRLRQLIEQSCPHCEYPIQGNYLRCPNCERRLRNPCRKCSKPLDPKWGICPYCEAEVVRRRRTEAGGERAGREGRRADRERRERADRGSERSSRPARSERPAAGGQRSGSQRSDGSRRTERKPVSGQKRPASTDGERSSRSSGRVSRPSR